MCHVHEADAAQRTDQKYHVEPAVIKVELQVAKNFRYDHSTFITVQTGHSSHNEH